MPTYMLLGLIGSTATAPKPLMVILPNVSPGIPFPIFSHTDPLNTYNPLSVAAYNIFESVGSISTSLGTANEFVAICFQVVPLSDEYHKYDELFLLGFFSNA